MEVTILGCSFGMMHGPLERKRFVLRTLELGHFHIFVKPDNYKQSRRLGVGQTEKHFLYQIMSYSKESHERFSIETFIPAESYILINLSSK